MKARTQSYGSSHRVSSSIPAPAWHVSSFWPLAEQEQNTHRTVPASYNQYSCLKQMEAKQTASDIDCILWNYWLSYQDQDHRHTTSEAPCASFTSHLLPSWDSSSSHLLLCKGSLMGQRDMSKSHLRDQWTSAIPYLLTTYWNLHVPASQNSRLQVWGLCGKAISSHRTWTQWHNTLAQGTEGWDVLTCSPYAHLFLSHVCWSYRMRPEAKGIELPLAPSLCLS